jgi:hypothetical protein
MTTLPKFNTLTLAVKVIKKSRSGQPMRMSCSKGFLSKYEKYPLINTKVTANYSDNQ